MSVDINTYVITGYDLSDRRKDIIPKGFSETEEYEDMACRHWRGEIQLFYDPMSAKYLYAGYIAGSFDDYGDPECVVMSLDKAAALKEQVDAKLDEWGIHRGEAKFSFIMFNEFT